LVGKKHIMDLFAPIQVGDIQLKNRIVMAPMTRSRANDDRSPNVLMAEYYSQRASAGLIISEATQISPQAAGALNTPGIHTEQHIQGWRLVTDSVHAQGGKIFLQLWHTGRASHPSFQPNGARPVSSSAVTPADEIHTPNGKQPFVQPRALELAEIPAIVHTYAEATKSSQSAGFDGVEIHAANGYLIDQFLRDGVNQRTDSYGGSIANRLRFMLEVTEAVVNAWSANHVGIRLSPKNPYLDMRDSDPNPLFTAATSALNQFNLAYLHIAEGVPGQFLAGKDEPATPMMRDVYQGLVMVNGGYDFETGTTAISSGEADAIAYGMPFLANPDLPARYRSNAPLNPPNPATIYAQGAVGYTDYPFLEIGK
jgi:N-ethylmaleimide reductase